MNPLGPKGTKRPLSESPESDSERKKPGLVDLGSANGLSRNSLGSLEDAFPRGDSAEWQRTIENVVKSVVSVQFAQVAPFDTDGALVSQATGFVVDAERGLILTNRHVVGPGPFCGYAVFDNHEECDVKPVYRDPVHDFGFLQFDPSRIKYMQVQQLELRPDMAKVGCEIRVVGNDAGEKLSILAGFISRLDRNAPDYGDLTYSDFNTEYIQAAASASGGSSGSPVVNIDGYVVALQAGGDSESSTDFFLPLFRGLRALHCIQKNEPVTRGTIQVQWLLKPYDECRRLGLSSAAEALARKQFPASIGMLVAETVLPEGPSEGIIEEGDILLSLDHESVSRFVRVDEILDGAVGSTVRVQLQRGGTDNIANITVENLHDITPSRYVEVAGGSFHDVSYQIARLYAIPVKGVYICQAGGSFRLESTEPRGWILDAVDDKLTPDLDAFVNVMRTIPDAQRVALRYRHLRDLHSIHYTIAFIDRHWRKTFRMATRNDLTGLWDFTDLGPVVPPLPLVPHTARFLDLVLDDMDCSSIAKSFVRVATLMPVRIDGFKRSHRAGYGLVVDAEKGYVVVSRYIVPHDLCDVSVTVAEAIVVPGHVLFLHPLQNYAIVGYDPKLVLAPVQSARLGSVPLKQGTRVLFVGHNHNLRMVAARTRVTDITTVTVPPYYESPRYRAMNLDAITVDTPISNQCGSGILADDDGTVRALWLTCLGERTADGDSEYRLGLDIVLLRRVIDLLHQGTIARPRFLDIELSSVQIVTARIRGVSEAWISQLEQISERRQLYHVMRVASNPQQVLEEGDIILSVNGTLVTRVLDLDVMYDADQLQIRVVRNKEELLLTVPTVSALEMETDRVIMWCGAILHRPHHAVHQQIKKIHSGVYVEDRAHGSPAYQYSITPTNFITHVNGQATNDLDSFLEQVLKIPDNTYVKLRVVTFDNIPFACSIKTNYHYFPTAELVKDKATRVWSSRSYDGLKTIE